MILCLLESWTVFNVVIFSRYGERSPLDHICGRVLLLDPGTHQHNVWPGVLRGELKFIIHLLGGDQGQSLPPASLTCALCDEGSPGPFAESSCHPAKRETQRER